MTKTLQLLRGTTAQNDSFTGHAGELTVDTTTNELRLHDGSTAGGHKIPNKAECQGLLGGGTAGTLLTNSGTPGTVNATGIDAAPTDGSGNPVSSDGVYDALATKADTATTLSGYGITDGADTDLSNLTPTGKGKLGPTVYTAPGFLLNSVADTCEGYGIVTVSLYPNGIARVDFDIQITANGTGSAYFLWGLNRNLIKNINSNIPTITPIGGGSLTYYNTSGGIADDRMGYGGTMVAVSEFWQPSRMYTTSGYIGGWPANACVVNQRLIGVCYGTYTV